MCPVLVADSEKQYGKLMDVEVVGQVLSRLVCHSAVAVPLNGT
jgi:hypothetical protein